MQEILGIPETEEEAVLAAGEVLRNGDIVAAHLVQLSILLLPQVLGVLILQHQETPEVLATMEHHQLA